MLKISEMFFNDGIAQEFEKSIKDTVQMLKNLFFEKSSIREQLILYKNLSPEQADEYIEKYWDTESSH